MYIALWTVDVNVPNPYYGPDTARSESQYIKESQQRFKRFNDKEELIEFVIANQKQIVGYYLVDKEVFPKLDVVVSIDI